MSESTSEPLRRVLIASANPLFARGLQKMVIDHWARRRVEVRLASSTQAAEALMADWQPDLVVVDYDDRAIHRAAFLNHFIHDERPMQVMLVSLRESGEVVVYDRRTLTPAQAEDWLDLPWPSKASPTESVQRPRSGSMRHYVIVGVLTVIVTVALYAVLNAIGILPVDASLQAVPVDRMWRLQIWMIAFLFSLITVAIVYSIVVFRQRPGETEEGAFFKGSTRLEVLWTLFPLVTVIYLSFLGAQALGEMRRVDPQALEIKVTGFQWGWIFEYPDYGIQTNILYMPVDRQAHLQLTSRDVIHSFWVPEFRVKQDALPGANLVKDLRVTPTRLGQYQLMCAEMCGGAHAYMVSDVKVVSQTDFESWVAEQGKAVQADPAARGQALAKANGCTGCHSLDGAALPGPTWQGLYGSQVKLTDGSAVTADEAYLHELIVSPNDQIPEGFPPNLMPQGYAKSLSDAQISDIIAFIKTLQ